MDCAEFQDRLSEYIDGTLDTKTETAVETHISVCENCKSELASLRAVVEELGALKPVKAPADFLEKIHERMAPSFRFDGIFRKLFIPFRIKIPLELAAAATLTFLIVLVLNIQYPGKQTRQISSPSETPRFAEKSAGDQVQSVYKKEAEMPAPLLEDIPAKPSETKPIMLGGKSKVNPPVRPSIQRESKPSSAVSGAAKEEHPVIKNKRIVLAMILKTATAGGVYKPGIAMKTAQIQKSDENAVRNERIDSDSFEGNFPARRKTPVTDLISSLKNIIQQYEGHVLNEEFDKQTEQLKSIDAEIPAKNYPPFCKELARLAIFQNPPPPLSDKNPATIEVLIRFIHP